MDNKSDKKKRERAAVKGELSQLYNKLQYTKHEIDRLPVDHGRQQFLQNSLASIKARIKELEDEYGNS